MIFPSHDDQEQEIISIIGKKESVEKAKKELEDLVCNLVNDIKLTIHFTEQHLYIINNNEQNLCFPGQSRRDPDCC